MLPTNNAPAFQFYPSDWLVDENVRLLTLEETGAYIDAIAICWREGSIPADPAVLSRLIGKGCSIEVATSVQRLFNVRSTNSCGVVERLRHKRLDEEREKQAERRSQQSEAGKKSANSRAKGVKSKEFSEVTVVHGPEIQHPFNARSTSVQRTLNEPSTHVQQAFNSSSSSSSSSSNNNTSYNPPLEKPTEAHAPNIGNPSIDGIEIDGKLVGFFEDQLRWQATFIGNWNRMDSVVKFHYGSLDHLMLMVLAESLKDPTWDWCRALKKFPLFKDGKPFTPTIRQFFSHGFVHAVLRGEYDPPKIRVMPPAVEGEGAALMAAIQARKNLVNAPHHPVRVGTPPAESGGVN